MIHAVTVSRITRTPDGATGGWTESWANAATGVACRVQPLTAKEIAQNQSVDSKVNCRVYFDGRPDVRFDDRLIFGADTIEVIGVRDVDRVGRLLTVDGYMQPPSDVTTTTTTTTTTVTTTTTTTTTTVTTA